MIDNSLLKLTQRFKLLQSSIENLPNAVEDMSTDFENQFLLNYRVHVYSLQKESVELKDKLKVAEDEMHNDPSIKQLENDLYVLEKEFEILTNETEKYV
jgi:hypothetical protein